MANQLSMSTDLSTTFAALADPTRRAILTRLASSETTVSALAEPFAMSGPAISKHLKVLEHAGLISRGRRNGGRAGLKPILIKAPPTGWRNIASSLGRKLGPA